MASTSILREISQMKKTYEKPTLVKRQQLSTVTAMRCVSPFFDTNNCVL
jgi:hypothetical protein